MQDNDGRFADDMVRLGADLGGAIESSQTKPTMAEQNAVLGDDSSLLRGLLAGMTFAAAPGSR